MAHDTIFSDRLFYFCLQEGQVLRMNPQIIRLSLHAGYMLPGISHDLVEGWIMEYRIDTIAIHLVNAQSAGDSAKGLLQLLLQCPVALFFPFLYGDVLYLSLIHIYRQREL